MKEDVGRIGLRLRLSGDERLSVGIQQRRQFFPDGGVCGRAEAETVVVFQNELPHLVVPRLRAKGDLARREFSVFHARKYAYPKRLLKKDRQFSVVSVRSFSSRTTPSRSGSVTPFLYL